MSVFIEAVCNVLIQDAAEDVAVVLVVVVVDEGVVAEVADVPDVPLAAERIWKDGGAKSATDGDGCAPGALGEAKAGA
jgi:hypothetical protein